MTIPIRTTAAMPSSRRALRRRRLRRFIVIWSILSVLIALLTCVGIFILTGSLDTSETSNEDVETVAQVTATSGATTLPVTPTATSNVTATPAPATVTPTVGPSPTSPPSATPTTVPTINAPEMQGQVAGNFEYGVHHTGDFTDEKWNLMRVAGMDWVKLQLRYTSGMKPEDEGWKIQFLHEQGFKILWGVVGDPAQVLNAGYFQEYATYVAGLASRQADAIEIWNEPNLDREWPNGRVDPKLYTELLKTAYQAIKAANPNTLVISGSPAPTGFFGGCQAGGCDDDVFYRGMAEAGAAQYMDCIGAHYNEGIVSPSATTGDPRNPYPTQYLMSNTDRAYKPFGGAVPLCYTELGYLTAEGYGKPLPPGFDWAQNVTVAQQSSWLATAALMLSQTGYVRLMIIWNLDYTEFEPDPKGGFAIIRPDGGCPACDSLGLIRAQ